MIREIVGAAVGGLIFGTLSFFVAREIYVSKANSYLISQRASVAMDVVRVMKHVEKLVGVGGLNGADCDVYLEYYTLIRSYINEVESGPFPIYGDDKTAAMDSINESLILLNNYRDRAGEQDCATAQVPI